MPRRMNRGDHGDVNVTRIAAEQLRRFLLAAGGDRIDVEEERFSGQMRLDRLRRVYAGCGSYRGDDDIRTASPAEDAQRTPIAAAARLSFSPSACGNRMSQAAMRSTPVSRRPVAIAWPASPKPMKHSVGFPSGIVGP
jgi:hypothetical protein